MGICCEDMRARNVKTVELLRRTFFMKKKYVEPTVLLVDYVVEDVMMASFNSTNTILFDKNAWSKWL